MIQGESKTKNDLWGIVAYFNPERYESKYKNFKIFRENSKRQGLNLLVVECIFDKKEYEISDNDAEIVIRVKSNSVLWQKERLLNIALQNLPQECTKVAWLDSDIIFLNDNWVSDVSNLLEKYNILQLFETVVRLKESQMFTKIEDFDEGCQNGQKRFGYIYTHIKHKEKNYQGSPGFAWAIRREIINKIGFFDCLIMGGADLVMSLSIYGDVEKFESVKSIFLKDNIKLWAQKFDDLIEKKAFYVKGVLLHLYHGDIKNRLYGKRYDLINKLNFNPHTDITINQDWVWEWSNDGKRFKQIIKKYFLMRNEGEKKKNDLILFFVKLKSYIKKVPGTCSTYIMFFNIIHFFKILIIKIYRFLRQLDLNMFKKIYFRNILKNLYKNVKKKKDDISIIIGVKDKPVTYLKNSLKSLRNQDYDQSLINIILVDYGSTDEFSNQYKTVCDLYNVNYIYARNIKVWNRSHCLNIGIKQTKTKYLLSSDVDIIFEKNYISEAIKELKRDPMQIIISKMLDASENLISEKTDVVNEYYKIKSYSTYRGIIRNNPKYFFGKSINMTYTDLYKIIRGYDENYILWGKEDDDLLKRFDILGIHANDISSKTSYIHQWHTQVYDTNHAQFKKNHEYFLKHNTVIRNTEKWGLIDIV